MSLVRVGLSNKSFAEGYEAIFKKKGAAKKAAPKKPAKAKKPAKKK